MSDKIKKFLITLFPVAILLHGLGGCGGSTKPPLSPSGKYRIKTTINNDRSNMTTFHCVELHLLDADGNELSRLQTNASDRMKWSVEWMKDKDIVILHSSDIGTRTYRIENNMLIETKKNN